MFAGQPTPRTGTGLAIQGVDGVRGWGMARVDRFNLPSTRGRLLVACPPLTDPNFDRTVVYMLEHGPEGALGVVLNRPSDDLDVEFDSWDTLIAPPSELFTGGPVDAQALIALALVPERTPDGQLIESTECISPVDLDSDPLLLEPRPTSVRVFHGYAGWGPQQLDGELEAGAWLVLTPMVSDVFTAHPDELWQSVLRRQRGSTAWLADCPLDPDWN